RVLNPATGDYVRNAEVTVRGTGLTAISGEDGVFRLAGVPAGDAVILVRYTGSSAVETTVRVTAGQNTARDIELISTLGGRKEDVVKLQAFTVSSEREGNAKAIMEQKNSMN